MRVRFGQEVPKVSDDQGCPACGTPRGACHHLECEREQCPRCGGVLRTCGCAQGASGSSRSLPRRVPGWARKAGLLALIALLTACAVVGLQWMMSAARREPKAIPPSASTRLPGPREAAWVAALDTAA